jgi:hypothetical protein
MRSAELRRKISVMPEMVVLDAMPLLLLFAMPMRINHQQDEDNQPSNKQNDDARLVLPQHSQEL